MPAVAKAAPDQPKSKKKKKRKIKPRVLKLKGWLKTPEDWAKFDAWVKVNAIPRKLPEPEPVIRKAVPFKNLKKRLKVLAKPAVRPPTQCVDQEIPCAALLAKPSRRIKNLAFPKIRITECNEPRITKAALKYKATETIEDLSQPKIRPITECRDPYEVSRGALKRKTTEKDDQLARPLKRRKLAPADCREGEKRCDTGEELSSWMEFLCIPAYRRLIGLETEQAAKWREQMVEELELRGKQAYEEQMRKQREEHRRCEEEQKRQEEERQRSERQKKRQEEAERRSLKSRSLASERVRLICHQDDGSEGPESAGGYDDDEFEDAIGDDMTDYDDTKSKSMKMSEVGDENEEEEEEDIEEEDEEAKEKRRIEKNKWREEAAFGCKEFPPVISDAAKNCQASPATEALAQPKKYKYAATCRDPYEISEAAKSAQASPYTEALAKPKHTSEPVKREPPREKDEFGMPIYPKPAYGKVMPERKPRNPPECKTEEEKEEEKKRMEEEKLQEEKPIDKIAYEPTIDPMFDPRAAKRQAKERERAAQMKAEAEKKEAEEAGEAAEEEAGDAAEEKAGDASEEKAGDAAEEKADEPPVPEPESTADEPPEEEPIEDEDGDEYEDEDEAEEE